MCIFRKHDRPYYLIQTGITILKIQPDIPTDNTVRDRQVISEKQSAETPKLR